ncbi:unnamed protein product [Allacma fusca]|uniref:Uncharacterized protein n=1 Tax=Allacma fusca TaxID=39272 RepID=A0A8J2PQV4_9HEXA|nr:unnamed protein product [Allacma fusca]
MYCKICERHIDMPSGYRLDQKIIIPFITPTYLQEPDAVVTILDDFNIFGKNVWSNFHYCQHRKPQGVNQRVHAFHFRCLLLKFREGYIDEGGMYTGELWKLKCPADNCEARIRTFWDTVPKHRMGKPNFNWFTTLKMGRDVGLLIPNGFLSVDPPTTVSAHLRRQVEGRRENLALAIPKAHKPPQQNIAEPVAGPSWRIGNPSVAPPNSPGSPTFSKILNEILSLDESIDNFVTPDALCERDASKISHGVSISQDMSFETFFESKGAVSLASLSDRAENTRNIDTGNNFADDDPMDGCTTVVAKAVDGATLLCPAESPPQDFDVSDFYELVSPAESEDEVDADAIIPEEQFFGLSKIVDTENPFIRGVLPVEHANYKTSD